MVLVRYAAGRKTSLATTLRSIAVNPFIWSSFLGLALNPLQGFLPAAATTAVDMIGRAALGVGLLAVGAGLDLRRLARPHLAHGAAMVFKFGAMPLAVSR